MYLLFDIGGTKIRLCVSDGETLGETAVIPTNPNFEEAIIEIEKTVSTLTKGQPLQAAFGGVRALDSTKTKLRPQPHFPLWENLPLKQKLEETLKAKVTLENDASLAGLGEAVYGAGKGYKVVAYLTISTGVGGVRIENGKIDRSSEDYIGQEMIDGQTFESLISGESLKRKYGKEASTIDDPEVWEEVANNLEKGLKIVKDSWSPDIIVLGGAVMQSIPLKESFVLSELGDKAGLYGALNLVKQSN